MAQQEADSKKGRAELACRVWTALTSVISDIHNKACSYPTAKPAEKAHLWTNILKKKTCSNGAISVPCIAGYHLAANSFFLHQESQKTSPSPFPSNRQHPSLQRSPRSLGNLRKQHFVKPYRSARHPDDCGRMPDRACEATRHALGTEED